MTKAVARIRRAPAPRGIVTAIVAVTGVEDEVRDIIVPGAFADTFKKIRPKVCYMHDWNKPLGRVLSILELKPGDKRLPKELPDGRAWPEKGGAIIATMQFHLGTTLGRDMFEHCRQWALNGEAAFSIGYRVVDGMSSKRADGVRLIYALNLYEVSLVLHGAHNMALALEVKSADGGEVVRGTGWPLETKSAPELAPSVGDDPTCMVALYPSRTVAEQIAVKGGSAPSDLHITLALPGTKDVDEVARIISPIVAGAKPLSGKVGGVGVFPPSEDGTPVWATVDVPGLAELRHSIITALTEAGYPHQSEHGFTPHMTLGYDLPSVSPLDPTEVAFGAVSVVDGDRRIDLLPATHAPTVPAPAGVAPGAAALEVKAARRPVAASMAVASAKRLPVNVPTVNAPVPALERKSMHNLTGSYEELRSNIAESARDLFPERIRADGGAEKAWVCVEATYPTHVILTTDAGEDPGEQRYYRVAYTADQFGNITLGPPEKVSVTTTVTTDPAVERVEADPDEARAVQVVLPAVEGITMASQRLAHSGEVKDLGSDLETAVLGLLDTLAMKGLDVPGMLGHYDEPDPDDEDGDDEEDSDEPALIEEEDDATLPAPDEVDPSNDTVTLDPEAVRAQIEELSA